MTVCDKCKQEKVFVYDSSTSSNYGTCACDLPEVRPARPVVQIKPLPIGKPTNNNYQCLICNKQLPQNLLRHHAEKCQINKHDGDTNRLICQYCHAIFGPKQASFHLNFCYYLSNFGRPTVFFCEYCGYVLKRQSYYEKENKIHFELCFLNKWDFVSGIIIRCPECSEIVKLENITAHNEFCSRRLVVDKQRTHQLKPPKKIDFLPPENLLESPCLYCRKLVKKTLFPQHSFSCPGRFKLVKGAKPPKKKRIPDDPKEEPIPFDEESHTPGAKKGSYQDLGGDDQMDATRGQGYRARENGRFGSHPIHDNYDD